MAAFVALPLLSCVSDLDFDRIAPQCEAPSFDAPSRDAFCSGQYDTAERVAAFEGKRFIGVDVQDEQALAVSVAEVFKDGNLTVMGDVAFHAVGVDAIGDIDATGSGDVTTLSYATDGIALVTPIGARWLDVSERMGAVLFPDVLIPAHLDAAPEGLEMIFSKIRLPDLVDEPQFFADMASLRNGDDLMVFLAAGSAGVKPLLYTFDDDTGRWTEKLVDVTDVDNNNHSCTHLCCRRRDANDFSEFCDDVLQGEGPSPGCVRELLPYCLTYPTGFGAFSLDVDPRSSRLYVGGIGVIFIYDAELLTVENIANLSVNSGQLTPISASVTIPAITAESLGRPVAEELAFGTALVADVAVHDDWLYAVLVNADVVNDNSASQPYLLQLRLERGLPTEEVFITELPVFESQTLFMNLLPLDGELLVYQTLESRQESAGERSIITQEDSGVFVLDLARREAPEVLFEEVINHESTPGVGVIGGDNGAGQFLLTTPAGIEVRELSVSGELL